MAMIEVKNLTKEYKTGDEVTHALCGVTCSIEQGEFVAIMGPSGSGKSTLLQILSFLERPTSGSYRFQDSAMEELTDTELAHIRNQKIGFIFQSFNLLGRSSVYENVELPLMYSKESVKNREKRVVEAVESVDLSDKLMIAAGKLSGGQKQRVAIARALVMSPQVIFADEPTGNLDSKSGAQVMEILDKLHNAGHTIILVTHETYTAEFAQRLIRLKDGQIESDKVIKERRNGKKIFFK